MGSLSKNVLPENLDPSSLAAGFEFYRTGTGFIGIDPEGPSR
jgi:hypothetical protein